MNKDVQPNNYKNSGIRKIKNTKPSINVTTIVTKTCSVYIEKGRFNGTASKLLNTKNKCKRMGR